MNESHILKSLNLTEGDSLTLEKAADRMEFEALPMFLSACTCNDSSTYTVCDPNCNCNGSNDTCSTNKPCSTYGLA